MSHYQKLNKIEDQLDTGDLLFFKGTTSISKVLYFVTDFPITHIGIVLRCPITNKKYIMETGDVGKDLGPFIIKKGYFIGDMHLSLLSGKLETLQGELYCRKLMVKDGENIERFQNTINKKTNLKIWKDFMSSAFSLDNAQYPIDMPLKWSETHTPPSLFPFTILQDLQNGGWNCVLIATNFYRCIGVISEKLTPLNERELFGGHLLDIEKMFKINQPFYFHKLKFLTKSDE